SQEKFDGLLVALVLLGLNSLASEQYLCLQGVHEAVECAVKIDDPSTFHGTDLTLAGIRKVGELSGGVIIMNSDIAFTEQDFDPQREDIALFIKNETAVHAFYRLRGELYAKTFELVSDSEGKVWVEGQIHLLNSARRSYPKNIVARRGDDYYLYDDGENARCVYDHFVSSTVIVSPATYNRIACNEFSEVDGIFQVIVNKK
uniref:Uncharacterized protein n=1 Tax=Ditylenchus dipsaci TaxID=166011 RepID=A0A915DFI4_9BILA